MEVEGMVVVARPPAEVAPLLSDVGRLASCVPGLQAVEVRDDQHIRAEMVIELPFARLPSSVDGRLRERRPDGLRFEIQGRPRTLAGAFMADVDIAWGAEGGGTRVGYRLALSLQGRLASLGEAMVRATSTSKGREFERALAALLDPA